MVTPTETQGGPGVVKRHRKAIPQTVKDAVLARDGMVCRRCGGSVVHRGRGEAYRPDGLHFDHDIPWAVGGLDTIENLMVSCGRCNLSRPKLRRIAGRRDVAYRRDGDDFYWTVRGYCPKKRLDHSNPWGFELIDAADVLYLSPSQMIAQVAGGRYPATQGTVRPIRVSLRLAGIDVFVRHRLVELGFEELGPYA